MKLAHVGLACHTQEEIAAAVDLPIGTIKDQMSKKEWLDLEKFPKPTKLLATFQDAKQGGINEIEGEGG